MNNTHSFRLKEMSVTMDRHVYIKFVEFLGRKKLCVNNGYIYFNLKKGLLCYLHRWIYENFVGKIPDGHDVHHIDGDKSNNLITNLSTISCANHNVLHKRGKGKLGQEFITEYKQKAGQHRKPFLVQIRCFKTVYRKPFDTIEEAIKYRDECIAKETKG